MAGVGGLEDNVCILHGSEASSCGCYDVALVSYSAIGNVGGIAAAAAAAI